MTTEKPRQVAERTLAAREDATRQAELDKLEREEAARRQRELEETEAVRLRAEAGKRAEELGVRRAEAEASLEAKMAEMNAKLEDLKAMDAEHRREIHNAGESLGAARWQDLGKAIGEWIQGSLLRNNPSSRARTLQEIDLLTVSEEPEGRAPAPGIPGSDPQDAPRREANRLLSTLDQRSTMLRRQYARDLSYGELVSPDEKDQVEQLSEEQREQVQGMLTGENGSE